MVVNGTEEISIRKGTQVIMMRGRLPRRKSYFHTEDLCIASQTQGSSEQDLRRRMRQVWGASKEGPLCAEARRGGVQTLLDRARMIREGEKTLQWSAFSRS